MRKVKLFFVCLVLILTASFSPVKEMREPNSTNITSVKEPNWIGLLETQSECEIYYSLVQCGEERKLLLKYFNEVPLNQNIKFKVTVKYLGYEIKEEKTKFVAPNQTIIGNCDSTDSNLFIKLLPPNWDFSNTTVTAELIEVTN
jgi:hypothetical protein